MDLARKRIATNLHQLTVKAVQNAGDGDLTDGGGLLLRIRGDSASWVFRYTAASGRRREMGLGIARRGSAAQAGEGLTTARDLARDARDLLARRVDPIDERDGRRAAAQALELAKKAEAKRERTTLNIYIALRKLRREERLEKLQAELQRPEQKP